jgi:hypothetical protein
LAIACGPDRHQAQITGKVLARMMEPNLNNDGLLPSAMALKDSLSQKPDTSQEPMMRKLSATVHDCPRNSCTVAESLLFFYPFLWTRQGTLEGSHRSTVPVSEAFDMKIDILKQLSNNV